MKKRRLHLYTAAMLFACTYSLHGQTTYTDGVFMLNEDWYGHNNSTLNFIRPDQQGKGYGKRLMEYAVHQKHIHKVDVNEQNGQACRFYQHMGFQVAGRDETDPMGKPFPILHLQLPTPPQITQIEHRL